MNTTERILSNGCYDFLSTIHRNNPLCAYHWQACIINNPGGQVPVLNPDEWEDQVNRLKAMVA